LLRTIIFSSYISAYDDNQKVFIKAQVDLSLALGQLIKVRKLTLYIYMNLTGYSQNGIIW